MDFVKNAVNSAKGDSNAQQGQAAGQAQGGQQDYVDKGKQQPLVSITL